MDIGESVRAARERRGWSQSDLARHAQLSPSTISRIESGDRPRPSAEVLRKIADALGVPFEQLAGTRPPEPPPPQIFGAVAELVVQTQTVSAGFGAWSDTQERYFVPADEARGHRLVAARVTGDCMEPDLSPGDLVIFDRGRLEPNEDEAVVCTTEDGQVLVKWFRRDSEGVVLSDNEGRELRPNGLKIEGTVYGSFRRRLRRRR